jgi:hypothetical protein
MSKISKHFQHCLRDQRCKFLFFWGVERFYKRR